MMRSLSDQLPTNLFRYVFAISWRHQIALVGLTVIAFLLEIVLLEIQRRVVNNLVKDRPFQLVIILCAAYAGAVLIQGATKLGFNIYRGWVSENATRDLRRHVIGYSRTAQADAPAEARGIGAAMIVAEVEPVGGFVGSSVSEPLLQAGILLSVLGYIVHLDRWMAAAALALFLPQLVFVPLMQGAINRRAGARVWVLRQLGISTVESRVAPADQDSSDARRIDRVLQLNMAIFRLKFSMNFPDELLQPSAGRGGPADRRLDGAHRPAGSGRCRRVYVGSWASERSMGRSGQLFQGSERDSGQVRSRR